MAIYTPEQKKEDKMTKPVTGILDDETYKVFKKLKEQYKKEGKTVTELFKQMILNFAEGRKWDQNCLKFKLN